MKSLIYFFVLCLVAVPFVACKKEVTTSPASLPVTASTLAGQFTVGSFVSNGSPTSTFSGFTFTFNENGTIVAAKGGDTFNGTWQLDDSNSSEIKISFADAPLNELNKGWYVAELTADHLVLTDDSKHEAGDDDHSSANSSIEFERD